MYRYIKNVPILDQATNRSKELSMLDSNSNELAIHVAKCVAYGDSLHCLKHWLCEEISDWIKLAGTVKLKKKRKDKSKCIQGHAVRLSWRRKVRCFGKSYGLAN